jgi:hypothetical protein
MISGKQTDSEQKFALSFAVPPQPTTTHIIFNCFADEEEVEWVGYI